MDRREFLGTMATVVAGGAACTRPILGVESREQKKSTKPIIPRRVLGKTGIEISVLILGGVVAMKEAPTAKFHPAELANAALDAGISYFDTAPSYGNGQSERNYGEVLQTRRSEVFLSTKTDNRSYDGTMREVEASFKRLHTSRLDLLQIHGVKAKEDFTKWNKGDGVLKALYKLRDEKVTRFIGVTGHESAESMLRAIELFDFDTILTTFNPTKRRLPYQRLVLPVARKKKMGILAMKVMGGGLGSLAVGNPIKNNDVWYHDAAPRQAEAGMLIRYALGLPISAAVVGMGSLEHLRTNVAAVRDAQPLGEGERKALEKHMS
ncbi:MAG: aldo/keto reductase [Planctomycetota bacterium]|jgi:aryl-alcohol dehydrogenase-like predicted oxidoreductase